jgi:mannose-1-phosphate guanylyltransferase
MVHIVLLSGGSGTRLWPLSNSSRSKQFLKVLRDADGNHVSMVQRVFGQIEKVDLAKDVTIATSESQRDAITAQVPKGSKLVFEPERRDTAPAIMLACENLALEQHAGEDETVIVMPIDTYADQTYYDSITELDEAVQSNASDLVLLGVRPTYPSEKYGYIVPTLTEDVTPLPVSRFTEKPDEAIAAELISQGALWNCGVFAFRLGWLLDLTRSYLNESTFEAYRENYAKLPKNSFDYEVVEMAKSITVIPYSGAWKDLGTWNTLTDEMAEPYSGEVVVDDKTVENVHVINETNLPLVVAGISDAVVVATPDGILVTGKEASAHIKDEVKKASENRPMYERRRWGEYRVFDSEGYADGSCSLTKELVISAGKQLSYQRHSYRSEIWTVTSGEGEIAIDGKVMHVAAGDVVNIPRGMVHACRGITDLHLIEVQLGNPLVEEDVERFGNFWGL